jgi:hypothetical protein
MLFQSRFKTTKHGKRSKREPDTDGPICTDTSDGRHDTATAFHKYRQCREHTHTHTHTHKLVLTSL